MRPDVLMMLAEGRADATRRQIPPPYVAHLAPKRASRLRQELADLGSAFGIPFSSVPDHREDEEVWEYLGIVLDDIHVYARSS